jgi:hypothetical protein
MKKALVAVAILVLSGCGYEGHYRYECQDPENWKNEECNPPICLVDGMCTENLIGFDPTNSTEIPQGDQP